MKYFFFFIGLMLAACLSWTTPAMAGTVPIEIAIDASGSMNAQIEGESRMDIAKRTVGDVFTGLDANIALRAFGHNYGNTEADKPQSCTDTELLLDFGGTSQQVVAAVDKLTPSGWTPLALTIQKAGEDLKKIQAASEEKPVLIILSDGQDSCDGDPVAEAKKLIAEGIDVTIHVIGFGVDVATKAKLIELAAAGNGTYTSAESATELKEGFEAIAREEGVEVKEAKDAIITAQAENIAIGGSTFDDARPFPTEFLGKEFSLSQHLMQGAVETFTLDVKEGDRLNVTGITGEKGIAERDGKVVESTSHNISALVSVFSANKVSIDSMSIGGNPLSQSEDSVRFVEDGTVYIFIGPRDNSSYGTPKDTRYIFAFDGVDYSGADADREKDGTEGDDGGATDDIEVIDEDREQEGEGSMPTHLPIDKNFFYIISGLIALVLVWMIIRALKK